MQKEVIQATLADDYGIDVTFRETTPIYIERPLGTRRGRRAPARGDESVSSRRSALRVEPGAAGSGIEFRLDVDPQTVPLYVYKTRESFAEHMEQYVRDALPRASSAGRSPTAS